MLINIFISQELAKFLGMSKEEWLVLCNEEQVKNSVGHGWLHDFFFELVEIEARGFFVTILFHKETLYLYEKKGSSFGRIPKWASPFIIGGETKQIIDMIKAKVSKAGKTEKEETATA